MKKYSIVGLSLLAVSAITAAFVPSKEAKSNGKAAMDGIYSLSTLQPVESGDYTCRTVREEDEINPNCSWTQTGNNQVGLSSTSAAAGDNSVTFTGNQTQSLTTAINVE